MDTKNISLRDYFAAKAMQALISASANEYGDVEYADTVVAKSAYEMADVMLKARTINGIRVYAEKVPEGSNGIWSGYEAHTMFPIEQSNATLLLDE